MSRALLKFSRQASVVEHAMLQRPAFQGRGVDGVLGLEAVGNVLQEDQAERDVLIVRRLHVAAELVGML